MRKPRVPCSRMQMAVIAALSIALAGCGGGGGDDGLLPTQLIDITLANRDDVAHLTAAGVMALPTAGGSFGMIPLAAGRAAASAWSVGPIAMLLQSQRAQGAFVGGERRHALALSSTDYPCDFGGALTETFDDRDGNNTISAGDVETIVYRDCKIGASETMNGTVRLTVTQISSASAAFQLDLVKYSDSTARHSLAVDGTALLDIASPSATSVETTMTARGPVAVTMSSHLPFSDTVTLQDGFVVKETVDAQSGQTASTFAGRLDSVAQGGMVDVTTAPGAPITIAGADDYPSAGSLRVRGAKGTLLLNVTSTQAVRLDLDANDDGALESSTTQSWDWLF
jgi:hypothetical protein